MKRRDFIRQSSLAGLILSTGVWPSNFLSAQNELVKLTILHTNDWHSRIEPFGPNDGRNANMGGAVRRANLIQSIRDQEESVLLLDSGDIFQGTPYFNYFKGELEFKIMSQMKYDFATIGNHDFDAGLEGLARQLPLADFTFLSANYDFEDTLLAGKIRNHAVIRKNGIRIGVFGLGIQLEGLVPGDLYGKTRYMDPATVARQTAYYLKHEQNCDLVICLSHLGYRYSGSKIDDRKLAANSTGIDLILGGHTHTFMKEPEVVKNTDGRDVIINQVGWAGLLLGRLDLFLDQSSGQICFDCKNIEIRS
ncbi:MAG TPA: metallophosphatase [Membranihabitans sp.]|nr:metallophosphatase [Membranihabitans sp.]